MALTSIAAKKRLAAGCGSFLILLTACSGSPETVDAGVTIREETESKPPIPSEPSAQILRELRAFGRPAPLGALQERLGIAPVMLDLGPHTFDELGISLTLDFAEYWRLDNAQPGSIAITRPDAGLEALLPAVTFHRPIGLAPPPLLAAGRLGAGSGLWDPQLALDDWIDAVPQVVVLDEGEIDVDGRPTPWWDVDVDADLGPTNAACQPGTCVEMMWSGSSTHSVARDLERIRWYEIPDEQGPIVVFISTSEADFGPVAADIHDLLLNAELGPSAPRPIPERTGYAALMEIQANEPWAFAGIPGLAVTAPNNAVISQRPGSVTARRRNGAGGDYSTGVVVPVSTAEGATFQSAAELAQIVSENADAVAETATETIAGYEATRIDFRHESDGFLWLSPPRLGYSSREAEWPKHEVNRVWVFDGPLGPTMIVVSAASDFEFELGLESFEWFIDSIGFCTDLPAPTDSCS